MKPGGTRFSAPWSTSLGVITILTLLLFLGLPVGLLVVGGVVGPVLAAVGFVVCGTVVVLAGLFAFIRGYSVVPGAVVIHRYGPDVTVELRGLTSVEVDAEAMAGTFVMPNGGLFSFGGRGCRNRKHGRYTAYATDPKRSVVLRLSDQVLVVTPHDPAAFVRAVGRLAIRS